MKSFFRNFLICSFILLVFGGAVFFIGWTQFKVKPGSCGIIISKTGGVSDEPVLPGRFSWHWEFLFPTNAELRTFVQTPYSAVKTITGTLPSGEVYGTLYADPPDFSYRFEFAVTEYISPESLIKLIKTSAVTTDESLKDYMNNAAESVSQAAAAYFLKKSSENTNIRPESLTTSELLRVTDAYNMFPEIEFTSFYVTEARMPDYALYSYVRERYLKNNEPRNSVKDVLLPAAQKEAGNAEKDDDKKQKASDLLDQLKSLF